MSLRDVLILASFILGLIPVVVLTAIYAWRANWRATSTGRAFFALFAVFTVWALLSVLTLIFPGELRGELGEWARILIRLGTDLVLWNILRVFLRAQKHLAGETPAYGIQMPKEPDRT